MMLPTDNETWLIEVGEEIVQMRASLGIECLSDLDKLIFCFWVADYGMRNAGDLHVAADIYNDFRIEGLSAALRIGLPLAIDLFSLNEINFQHHYFELFEAVCAEIKNAKSGVKKSSHGE